MKNRKSRVTDNDVSGWEEVSMAEYEAWKEAEKAKESESTD